MDKLTNIIEAVLFASGKGVELDIIADKLNVSPKEVKKAISELEERYGSEGGIRLLQFNNKAQLASNPTYKTEVEAVLNPIREKELTRTILECAAIVAYKQPVTKTEIEYLRGLNSDYAVHALLELKLIYPCGRKDSIGRPILYATDEFLKRFKLNSLADLPDYDELMDAIHRPDTDNYLYAREEYGAEEVPAPAEEEGGEETSSPAEGGYEIPDFLRGLDESDLVKIG